MSNKSCYFKCKHVGQLYGFPPVSYSSYEKFHKWKSVLRKKDQEKDDHYIKKNFKLCNRHFEPHYIVPNKRLTRHAVPTLKLGLSTQQEELLCSILEKNSNLVTTYNLNDEIADEEIEKWKKIAPQLNALGPEKSCMEWAEYLYDVMSDVKTKQVTWTKGTYTKDPELVQNREDFTDLELKILKLWHTETMHQQQQESPDRFEMNVEDENGVEYMIEVEDSEEEEEEDSKDSDTSNNWTPEDNGMGKKIVTFMLNVANGLHKPLLQAADIAPQDNTKCKCTHSDNGEQDEFDAFGREIAQQLRSMPAQTALETQQLLVSIIRNKQSKIINDSFLM